MKCISIISSLLSIKTNSRIISRIKSPRRDIKAKKKDNKKWDNYTNKMIAAAVTQNLEEKMKEAQKNVAND